MRRPPITLYSPGSTATFLRAFEPMRSSRCATPGVATSRTRTPRAPTQRRRMPTRLHSGIGRDSVAGLLKPQARSSASRGPVALRPPAVIEDDEGRRRQQGPRHQEPEDRLRAFPTTPQRPGESEAGPDLPGQGGKERWHGQPEVPMDGAVQDVPQVVPLALCEPIQEYLRLAGRHLPGLLQEELGASRFGQRGHVRTVEAIAHDPRIPMGQATERGREVAPGVPVPLPYSRPRVQLKRDRPRSPAPRRSRSRPTAGAHDTLTTATTTRRPGS